MRVGACDCWRARWWSSASSRPPAIQRSSGCSKKRAPAAPPQILGHPAQGQRRVRSGDGGRAVGLHAAARPGPPGGLSGRDLQATRRRKARAGGDYAHVLKDLADVHFAQAETIVLIQDNLNTHAAASLYEAFPAPEARRLVERFEWHYTPKHGSWLDLAESELGVLASQCLDRRIPDKQAIINQVDAWVRQRNKTHAVAECTSQRMMPGSS